MTSPDNKLPRNAAARKTSDITDQEISRAIPRPHGAWLVRTYGTVLTYIVSYRSSSVQIIVSCARRSDQLHRPGRAHEHLWQWARGWRPILLICARPPNRTRGM